MNPARFPRCERHVCRRREARFAPRRRLSWREPIARWLAIRRRARGGARRGTRAPARRGGVQGARGLKGATRSVDAMTSAGTRARARARRLREERARRDRVGASRRARAPPGFARRSSAASTRLRRSASGSVLFKGVGARYAPGAAPRVGARRLTRAQTGTVEAARARREPQRRIRETCASGTSKPARTRAASRVACAGARRTSPAHTQARARSLVRRPTTL